MGETVLIHMDVWSCCATTSSVPSDVIRYGVLKRHYKDRKFGVKYRGNRKGADTAHACMQPNSMRIHVFPAVLRQLDKEAD